MKQAIVVDSNTNHRSTLLHQLSSSAYSATYQFKTLSEAHNKLLSMTLFTGVLLVTIEDDIEALVEFLGYARAKHPQLTVIAVVDSLSLNQMRTLVSTGVDHVLLRPFDSAQLLKKIDAAESFRIQVLSEVLKSTSKNTFTGTIEQISDYYYKTTLRGNLVENCALPEFPGTVDDATLFVDCDSFTGINSIGIRSWILWIKALQSQGFKSFEFENVHPPILQQASLLQGFIPPGSVVSSFYLYYWCQELSQEKEFIMVYGKNYGSNQMKLPKIIRETHDGKTRTYELDQFSVKLVKFFDGKVDVITPKESVH